MPVEDFLLRAFVYVDYNLLVNRIAIFSVISWIGSIGSLYNFLLFTSFSEVSNG